MTQPEASGKNDSSSKPSRMLRIIAYLTFTPNSFTMRSLALIRNGMLFSMLMTLSMLPLQAQSALDEKAIRKILDDEDVAWLAGDAIAYSKSFAAEGTFTNIRGDFHVGKKAFEERHDDIFKTIFNGTTLTHNVTSLKFLKEDVAVVEVIAWVSGFSTQPPARLVLDAKGRLVVRLLQVVMRDKGEWKIYAYHNVAVGPGGPLLEPK